MYVTARVMLVRLIFGLFTIVRRILSTKQLEYNTIVVVIFELKVVTAAEAHHICACSYQKESGNFVKGC